MVPRRFRVVGCLGRSAASPLLAEQLGPDDGVLERVVLDRVYPQAAQVPVRMAAWPGAVAQRAAVVTDRGTWGISPYIPGADLFALRGSGSDGLELTTVRDVISEVLSVLNRLADDGVHHGDLTGSKVRIDESGLVRIVGWRGGDEAGDCAAVRELFELLHVGDGAPLSPQIAAQLDGWPTTLDALSRDFAADAGTGRSALAALSRAHPVELTGHELVGAVLVEAGAAPRAPGKVQLALVGAVMLLLGMGIAFALTGLPF